MRNQHHVLFPWANQDRADDEIPRFRELASRWHPVVRCRREEDEIDGFVGVSLPSDAVAQHNSPPRPTWSPWLWVKR